MKYDNIIYKFFFITLFTIIIPAYAIEWSNAPLACLPSRAEKWLNSNNIPLCHCPPQSYCPSKKNMKPKNISFIVEWHWSNGTKESGKISGNNITDIKNGTIKVKDIFKYTPEQMKELVYTPILQKFKIDTKTATDVVKGYIKDTTVKILLKENNALAEWINNTLKLPIDIATRCCDSVCPNGTVPTYENTQVVDPKSILKPQYTMTKGEHDDYETNFRYAYQKAVSLSPLLNSEYNASIDSLHAFYQTQASTPNLEIFLSIVKSFLAQVEKWEAVFPVNEYNLLIMKFSALQTRLQDELKRRKEPTKYINVKAIVCTTNTTYSREGCLHGGTKITMADGTFKTIETLKLGDEVKGNHGASKIIALSKFTQKEDRMYSINGGKAFFTVEHPVLTPQGWKSIDSTITSVKSNAKIIGTLQVGDIILMDGGKQLKVTSIKEELLKGGIDAYNLSVTGDGSFIANGFIMKSFKQMQMHY